MAPNRLPDLKPPALENRIANGMENLNTGEGNHLFRPTVGFANIHHRLENGVPGLGILERCVGEHAAVPADVPDPARGRVLQPIARTIGDVELAVGVVRRAMLAGLVVRALTVHLAIVLGDMPM